MTAATTEQVAASNYILNRLNVYQGQLSDAFDAAANAGNAALADEIHRRYTQAVDLQTRAASLKTQAMLAGLQAAAAALKVQTDKLNAEKQQIDAIVNTVGVAATILSTIGQIATAMAGLMALL